MGDNRAPIITVYAQLSPTSGIFLTDWTNSIIRRHLLASV